MFTNLAILGASHCMNFGASPGAIFASQVVPHPVRGLRDLADGEILLSVMRDINPEETGGDLRRFWGVGDQKLGKTWGKTMEKTMENDGKNMENDGKTMET